jgi:hypothetical protein
VVEAPLPAGPFDDLGTKAAVLAMAFGADLGPKPTVVALALLPTTLNLRMALQAAPIVMLGFVAMTALAVADAFEVAVGL